MAVPEVAEMNRRLARIEVYWDDSSEESSATRREGPGEYVIQMGPQSGDERFKVETNGQFATTLAHELGHVIALMLGHPSHLGPQRVRMNGDRPEMINQEAERVAWRYARLILPDEDLDADEVKSLDTYRGVAREDRVRRLLGRRGKHA